MHLTAAARAGVEILGVAVAASAGDAGVRTRITTIGAIMRLSPLRLPFLLAVGFSLLSVGACGRHERVLAPPEDGPAPLAEMVFGWGFGVRAESVQYVALRIGYSPRSSWGCLGTFYLDQHDEGDLLVMDGSTSAGFSPFVAMMTNGIADTVQAEVWVAASDGGGLITAWKPEASALILRPGIQGPDLADTTVSRLELCFDRLRITIPGSDGNHDGHWVDIDAFVTLRAY